MLALENKRRDKEERSTKYDDVYIKKDMGDGTIEKQHVDKVSSSSRNTEKHRCSFSISPVFS